MTILSLALLFGCTVTEKGAKRKIRKHKEKIEELVKLHPSLIDSNSVVVKETITLPQIEGNNLYDIPRDTLSFDKLIRTFVDTNRQLDSVEKLLHKKPNWVTPTPLEPKLRETLEERHRKLVADYNVQKALLQKGVLQDTTFTTEDDKFKFTVDFKDGKIKLNYVKKEEKITYDKAVTTVSINATKVTNWKAVCVGIFLGVVICALIVLRIRG